MNTTFHPDEVPEHLKDAARDCQDVAGQVSKRLLGPFKPDELPEIGTCPAPVIEGQTLVAHIYDRHSLQHIADEYHICIFGEWHFFGTNRLTPSRFRFTV